MLSRISSGSSQSTSGSSHSDTNTISLSRQSANGLAPFDDFDDHELVRRSDYANSAIDELFADEPEMEVVSEYLKACLGLHSKCPDGSFVAAARGLHQGGQPCAGIGTTAVSSPTDLALRIYRLALKMTSQDNGQFDNDNFIAFMVQHLGKAVDEVKAMLPHHYFDEGVVEQRKAAQSTGEPNNAEFPRPETEGSALASVPTEVLHHMFGFVCGPADRARLSLTDRAMQAEFADHERDLVKQLTRHAQKIDSLDHVHELIGSGDDTGHADQDLGAVGRLRPDARIKVLTAVAHHLDRLTCDDEDKQRAYNRILDVITHLPLSRQAEPLIALSRSLTTKSEPAGKMPLVIHRIFNAAHSLLQCNELSAGFLKMLVRLMHANRHTMQEDKWSQKDVFPPLRPASWNPPKAMTLQNVYEWILDATSSVLRRDRKALNDFPGHLLGELHDMLQNRSRSTHLGMFFKLVNKFPHALKARVITDMLDSSVQPIRLRLQDGFFRVLRSIQQLPLSHQAEPLAGLIRRTAALRYPVGFNAFERYEIGDDKLPDHLTGPILTVVGKLRKESRISGELFVALVELFLAQKGTGTELREWLVAAAKELGRDPEMLKTLSLGRLGVMFERMNAKSMPSPMPTIYDHDVVIPSDLPGMEYDSKRSGRQQEYLRNLITIFSPLPAEYRAQMVALVLKSGDHLFEGKDGVAALRDTLNAIRDLPSDLQTGPVTALMRWTTLLSALVTAGVPGRTVETPNKQLQ